MTRLLAVIPVITTRYTDRCVYSITASNNSFGVDRDDILLVDNSREGWAAERYGLRTYRDPNGHNLGCSRSWNVAVREVLERNLDYLVIMSAAMVFGPRCGPTWQEQIDAAGGAPYLRSEGHMWHLIALHASLFRRVGLFDENLYPALYEDVDFEERGMRAGLRHGGPEPCVNALSQGFGGHLNEEHVVSVQTGHLTDYLFHKWGGPIENGSEYGTYDLPWGDRPMGYWPETSIPVLAKRYRLGVWW